MHLHKTGPLVSVLIPCYNAGRWISETLNSVKAQTWKNIEIIVVNDGSTDNSKSIIEKYTGVNLTLINQPNCGQATALNRCLSAANGEYIQYLDADDLLSAEKIEMQMTRLIKDPECIATAEWGRFSGDPVHTRFKKQATWQDWDPVDWLVADWHDGEGMMYPAMWLLPRKLADKIGPWREDLTLITDMEYFTRAVLASRKVLFCEGARTYYRSGIIGSVSQTRSMSAWQSGFDVIRYSVAAVLHKENSARVRRCGSLLWQVYAHSAYPYSKDLANLALLHAANLHPIKIYPNGGPAFALVSLVVGWKAARLLQKWSGRR
ncbi:MAG: glycosyltransferase family 2 protein [Aeromicrobium sp.]|nr:glycosyltransferase family 2 protein [Burkholderiales bacterium]